MEYSHKNIYNTPTRWQSDHSSDYFYHYTSRKNWESIKNSGYIQASTPSFKSGHPSGVYLTTLAYTKEQAQNMSKVDFNKLLVTNNFGPKHGLSAKNLEKHEVVIRIKRSHLPSTPFKKLYKRQNKSVYLLEENISLQHVDLDNDVLIRNINDIDFE